MLRLVGFMKRKMKEYENWKAKHPTKYEVLRKKRSEWYLKMKKAGIKFKKRNCFKKEIY